MLFSLICAWINGVNNDETCDLRRSRSLWRHCNDYNSWWHPFQVISITHAGIKRTDNYTFSGHTSLVELNLNYNKLTSPPLITSSKDSLNILRLNHNLISEIRSNYFHGFKKLEHIYFSNNLFQSAPDLSLSVQRTIQTLHLSHNQIENIDILRPKGQYQRLRYIHLQNNTLDDLSIMFLQQIPNISQINIEHNHFHTLVNLVNFTMPVEVRLTGNPLHCDQQMLQVVQQARREKFIENYISATCSTPSCVAGWEVNRIGRYTKKFSVESHSLTWINSLAPGIFEQKFW